MGRRAQTDDEERLPEGFERVGYDADTQTYTFRDANGKYYEGGEGNRFGTLWPAGKRPSPSPEATALQNAEIESSNREALRQLLPFALLVLALLGLLFHFLSGPSFGHKQGLGDADDVHKQHLLCGKSASQVQILEGQTCWAIAESYGVGVEELLGLKGNEDIDCDVLTVNGGICVPL